MIATAIQAAIRKGDRLEYQESTGDHQWFVRDREEVRLTDENQPVPEAQAEASAVEETEGQAPQEVQPEPVVPVLIPPINGRVVNGQVLHP